MDFVFEAPNLTLSHVRHIVQSMYAVAQVDGLHPSEHALLQHFYEACREEVSGLTDFESLIEQEFDLAAAQEDLQAPEHKAVLLQSCLFLAHCDGEYSSDEANKISEIAKGLGVEADALENLTETVRDSFLKELAHIKNMESLTQVAKELKGS